MYNSASELYTDLKESIFMNTIRYQMLKEKSGVQYDRNKLKPIIMITCFIMNN